MIKILEEMRIAGSKLDQKKTSDARKLSMLTDQIKIWNKIDEKKFYKLAKLEEINALFFKGKKEELKNLLPLKEGRKINIKSPHEVSTSRDEF
jgi:hypothetical protein